MSENKKITVARDHNGIPYHIKLSSAAKGEEENDRNTTVLEFSDLRRAELLVMKSGMKDRQGFLRELLQNVEMELDDYGDIRYLEDQIARCFEEEDFHDLEHYKAQILDLIMHSLGLATYERMYEKPKRQTKTNKR